MYRCECGTLFRARATNINQGVTKSCGCYQKQTAREKRTTHGLYNNPLYHIWNAMVSRCTNYNNNAFPDYGGRGIYVCDEWLSVANFIKDMHPTFKEGLSIDRIDNNLGYSKDNCRWVTRYVQNRNTRRIRSNNTSGYRGVSFCKTSNKYMAKIGINGKKEYLGIFCTAVEAAIAYDSFIAINNLEHTVNNIGK